MSTAARAAAHLSAGFSCSLSSSSWGLPVQVPTSSVRPTCSTMHSAVTVACHLGGAQGALATGSFEFRLCCCYGPSQQQAICCLDRVKPA